MAALALGILPTDFHDGVFVLAVPNGLIRERVESRYLPMIEDTLANEVGSPVRCRLEVLEAAPIAPLGADGAGPSPPTVRRGRGRPGPARDEGSRSWFGRDDGPPPTGPDPVLPVVGRNGNGRGSGSDPNFGPGSNRSGRESPAVQLDSKFTFETFVAASSNRLAHAAAQAVAETPGRSYNPLFIYGDSGLGKTHLLHAIGNYVTENYPRRKVLYVTTETFMNDFVDSLRTSTTLAFKRRYRDCDVLLIDDVQFMERKEGLQEEFFHTYNDLKGASKQIVLTSDRPPKSIETLEDRLRSRFLSGLITEIDPPDLETRLAILRSKSMSENQDVPDDVLEFIASHVKDNIRELEGALIRICAFAKLNNESISLSQAEDVLSDLVRAGEPRRISPQMILETTAAAYGFSVEALIGPSRTRPLVTARPGGHVPHPGPHGLQLSGHRPGLREAGPHDRHPRRRQDHPPNAGTPADLRPGNRTDPEDPCRLGLNRPSGPAPDPVMQRQDSLWTMAARAGDRWATRPQVCATMLGAGRVPSPSHLTTVGTTIVRPTRAWTTSSTIHSPYYLYS